MLCGGGAVERGLRRRGGCPLGFAFEALGEEPREFERLRCPCALERGCAVLVAHGHPPGLFAVRWGEQRAEPSGSHHPPQGAAPHEVSAC